MQKTPQSPVPDALKKARWIWQGLANTDLHNSYALFRKSFTLDAIPRKARVLVTADQSYRLYLNGRYVCGGPARGFQSHWPFDEIDIRPWLKKGKNIIAVRAHHPGCGTFSYISEDTAGLLLALEAGKTLVVTDGTWKVRRQTEVRKDVAPLVAQMSFQEHIDLREEPAGWTGASYDDSSWKHPKDQPRVWNAMPWYSLETRGIPLLREDESFKGRLVGTAAGRSAKGAASTRDVYLTRHEEGFAHKMTGPSRWPLTIEPSAKGQWRSYLVDFSRTVVGCPILTVNGASGGEIVDLTFHEVVDPENLAPYVDTNSWSDIALGNRAILRKGKNEHTFFHPMGFRYAVVTVRDATKPLKLDLSIRRMAYPFTREGSFHSSDQTLDAIWESCAWTQECCSLDAYVDTPWREQAQWWGDARVQAWNTFHFSNDARLLRRGIHCIASQTIPNGLTYAHAPTKAHSCILPDFCLTWILTLWDHYWQTGSTEAFETHEATALGILGYFRDMTDAKTGLVRFDDRYWLFLDWTTLHREGCPSVLNLWLLEALDKLALLYAAAGRKAEAKPFEAWSKRLCASLQKLISKEGLLADGYDAKGKIVAKYSIHSQTLALITGLSPKHEKIMLEKSLLPYIRGEQIFEAMPSSYWVTYVLTELSKRGYGAEVIAFIKKHWTKMAEHGTTWETFEPGLGNESFSHAWSAHPIFHLMQILGGIRQTAAGWKAIAHEPLLLGESLECTVPTPHGPIISSWKRRGDTCSVELKLPKGVVASSRLPGHSGGSVRGSLSKKIKVKAAE